MHKCKVDFSCILYIDFCVYFWYNDYAGNRISKSNDSEVTSLAIRYRFDVLAALKEKGYSTYTIRKDKLLSEGTIQKLRESAPVSAINLNQLCRLLQCQPGDLLEYVDDD